MAEEPEFEFGADGLPKRVSAADRRRRQAPDVTPGAKGKAKKEMVVANPNTGAIQQQTTPTSAPAVQIIESSLPGGGVISLMNPQEANFFETLKKRYTKEFALTKPNDLARLSQLLIFELTAHRMTQRLAGHVPQYDSQGQFIGYEVVDADEIALITKNLPSVQSEIRSIEQHLRLDKKSREGHGQQEIKEYMETLKRAAKQYGVHLSDRYKKYDEFRNELAWKLRVLDNADSKDKAYHNISEESIIKYMRDFLAEMDDFDKSFAHDKQSVWVGKI